MSEVRGRETLADARGLPEMRETRRRSELRLANFERNSQLQTVSSTRSPLVSRAPHSALWHFLHLAYEPSVRPTASRCPCQQAPPRAPVYPGPRLADRDENSRTLASLPQPLRRLVHFASSSSSRWRSAEHKSAVKERTTNSLPSRSRALLLFGPDAWRSLKRINSSLSRRRKPRSPFA